MPNGKTVSQSEFDAKHSALQREVRDSNKTLNRRLDGVMSTLTDMAEDIGFIKGKLNSK